METDCLPLVDGLAEAAGEVAAALIDLKRPMAGLAEALAKKLDAEAEELSTHDRGRIEAVSRSLRRRGELMVGSWIDMLTRLLDGRRIRSSSNGSPSSRPSAANMTWGCIRTGSIRPSRWRLPC